MPPCDEKVEQVTGYRSPGLGPKPSTAFRENRRVISMVELFANIAVGADELNEKTLLTCTLCAGEIGCTGQCGEK